MYTILVADDEPVMLRMVERLLHKEGHEIIKTTSAQGVLNALDKQKPDLLLIDVNLPDRNGLALCQELRRSPEYNEMPIVFLTGAASSPDDIADALNAGGDDYIHKPFAARELAARIRAQLRRVKARREVNTPMLRLVAATNRVYINSEEIELTRVEFNLLYHLCKHADGWLTTRDLLEDVWRYPGNVGDAALVRNHIRNLRLKIEPNPDHPTIIVSRHRRGYMVSARVEFDGELSNTMN